MNPQDANAFAALKLKRDMELEAQAPAEAEAPPIPDEEIQRVLRSAHGALSLKNSEMQAAAQSLEPKPVAPEVQRAGLASSYGALASKAPPPPVAAKPSPVPVGLQDRVAPPPAEPSEEAPEESPLTSADFKAALSDSPTSRDDDPEPPGVNQWALAADLMLNGGRRIQQIVGMAQQQKAAWQQAKRQKFEDAQRLQQYELGKGNLEARIEENKTTAARNARELRKLEHPDEFDYETKSQTAKREMDEWHAKHQADIDYMRLDAEGKRAADAAAERKADNTRADDQAKETHRHNLTMESGSAEAARDRAEAAKDRTEAREAKHARIPGTTIDSSEAFRAATGTDANRKEIEKQVALFENTRSAFDRMISLRKEYGTEVLPSEANTAMDLAKTQLSAALAEIGHTGVVNKDEWIRHSRVAPDLSPHWSDAVDAVKGGDTVLRQLETLKASMDGSIGRSLAPYGIRLEAPATAGSATPAKTASTVETDQPKAAPTALKSELPPATEPASADGSKDAPFFDGPPDELHHVKLVSPNGKPLHNGRTVALPNSVIKRYFDEHWTVRRDPEWDLGSSDLGDTGKKPPLASDAPKASAAEDPIGKWTKRGRIAAPKADEDPLKKYRDMGLLVE
jgi:hypothetical protein